jgi:hypothetical protein
MLKAALPAAPAAPGAMITPIAATAIGRPLLDLKKPTLEADARQAPKPAAAVAADI